MTEVLLQAEALERTFGQVQALRGANFTACVGEIVALIGDNGAGKSTLMKCLCGADQPTGGRLLLEGREVHFASPAEAQRLGIETVYQDLALAPDLDAAANLYLGREVLRSGFLGRLHIMDKPAMRAASRKAFAELGTELPRASTHIASLSGGQRQNVAVTRAVFWASRLLFMDEPTAALGVIQRRKVLDVMRRIRDRGITVVLISHNMPEVLSVADRIEVLRLGRRVARFKAAEASLEELVAAMTGALEQESAA
jgi:simple sugar transport system ATP-binding protein